MAVKISTVVFWDAMPCNAMWLQTFPEECIVSTSTEVGRSTKTLVTTYKSPTQHYNPEDHNWNFPFNCHPQTFCGLPHLNLCSSDAVNAATQGLSRNLTTELATYWLAINW
jgi:hypothetical protein